MHTAEILQTIRRLQSEFQQVGLENVGGLSAQLEKMRRYFDMTTPGIRAGAIAQPLDPDYQIDLELEKTEHAISHVYREVRRVRGRRAQPPSAAVETVFSAARAAYAAAVRLQCEIGAHDVGLMRDTAGHAPQPQP
ncbi:MAG TPA: hypothetical protein VF670_15005 [Duganella sp.]